jgi:hypothetical protein
LEQKSEKVQNLITSILSKIMQLGNSFSIETSSFIMNYSVLNSSSLPTIVNLKNSLIQMPSFFDLIHNINNCSKQTIILKVKFFTKTSLIYIIKILLLNQKSRIL